MAESITSQINFSQLFSHTFPGIFTTISIFMMIDIIFYYENVNRVFQIGIIFENWITFIVALSGLVFFGTITGVIIDSIHHMIVSKIIDVENTGKNTDKKTVIEKIIDFIHSIIVRKTKEGIDPIEEINADEAEVFLDLKNGKRVGVYYFIGFLPLERFQFLIDNLYSYVECEFNLSISFFFSSFIYGLFIFKCGCSLWIALVICLIMIGFSIIGFYSAVKLYIKFRKNQLDIIKGAIKYHNDVTKYGKL